MKHLLLILVLVPLSLFATTITVVNTNDAGAGSLRQAVIDAVAGDTVAFDPMLISTGSATVNLASEIAFNKAIVIKGIYTSYDTLYISGMNTNRIFNISTGAGTVTLKSLALMNGNDQGAGGGAIYQGGGGTLWIDDCLIMNNTSTGYGGAIYKSSGALTMTNCQVFDNTTVAQGGAIYLSPGSGNTFEHTTFYKNGSNDYGGAIYGFVANCDFLNCTFNENYATNEGGAIYDWGSAVLINVTNCTFIGNTAASSGGIDLWGSNVEFTATSSVFVDNLPMNLDIWGAGAILASNGYNVFGATFSGAVGSDQQNVTGAALNMGVLQDNGETTFTMMPNAGSVAINLGNPGDLSPAQNGPVTDGLRDAGSAENYSCPDKVSSFFAFDCAMYTVPSGDESYSTPGLTIATDTIPTVCGADSVMTIYIYIGDIEAPDPDVASLADLSDACSITPTPPTATDCSGPVTGTTTTVFPITAPGTTVITWTYDDGLGNISTQQQNAIITGVDVSVSQAGFTLTANATGSTYQWIDCNNGNAPVAGETNADFTATSNGSYAVEVTTGTCTETSACYAITGIGVEENTAMDFSVYPNPTTGVFTISATTSQGYFSVYSADGKMVLEGTALKNEQQSFDISNVERGIYFVTLVTEFEQKTVRLLVE